MVSAWHVTAGRPYPLGAKLTAEGCNFVVHCPDAHAVELCLFDSDTEEQIAVIPLPAKTGKVWHCHIAGITEGQYYGYRVRGAQQPELGLCFDPQKLLIDPYAKALSRSVEWDFPKYQDDSEEMIPKCVVIEDHFDWLNVEKPNIRLQDTILYEAHVKGLTQLHPDVPKKHRGKFLGVCDPAVIRHLKNLGITAIQLMPVAASMPEPYISEKGLTNYWGYNPINFFTPDPKFAVHDAVHEFKTMVRTLHAEGLEVILDVVFNHTAEGGERGQLISFKGFDNTAFYLFENNDSGGANYHHYSNNSGCGNSVNTAHHYPMRMVLDALRYWVEEMGVDGFRFDLAASLGRDPHEFSNNSGFFRALRQDPVLQGTKLIAEPWDIGHGGYRLGQFPSNWVECNDKYRDNVRAFWRGDKGLTSDFATRLLGSRDVFRKNHRAPFSSVNYIAYHDGFTLQDLVSYNERHNEANGEQNRDGHGHNVSFNYGVEGETRKPAVIDLRERQKRNLIATLFLSQGVPHFLAGDELSRTQKGNNNAYCQDNKISWLDWKLNERKKDFLEFCQFVINLRKESELLTDLNLEDDNYYNHYNVSKVGWFRPDGAHKIVDDWHDADNQAFAVELKGEGRLSEHWLILFNASDHDVRFQLPKLEPKYSWRLQLDTRYQKLRDIPNISISDRFLQTDKSVSIFRKRKN